MNSERVAGRHEEPEEQRAPEVVSEGLDWGRERVQELARQHGVPARVDPETFALLSACDVDDEVDPEMHSVLAAILAWLHASNRELRDAAP